MKVLVDSGPLIAAANIRDEAHRLASTIVTEIGPELIVLETVIVETDHMLRSQVGPKGARDFLASLLRGAHTVAFLTPDLLRSAADFDERYGALNIGITDASVMAFAQRHRLPILTFDFKDFRATKPAHGWWRLVVDEARYRATLRN